MTAFLFLAFFGVAMFAVAVLATAAIIGTGYMLAGLVKLAKRMAR